jgi:hypothetical protein
MALDLTTLIPADVPIRSAIQMVRRMMLLRWSVGNYLTAIAGNYGVIRPPLGFFDDDFFRACAQALMADYKTIPSAFWQLLEITLGPYNNLVFDLEIDREAGDGYIVCNANIEYSNYTNWNATPFQHDELLTNGSGVEARFRYLDQQDGKIHYNIRRGGEFQTGDTLTGTVSGGTVDLTSGVLRQVSDLERPVFDRMPLYGAGVLDPGGPNEEDVLLVTTDHYLRRIRLRDPLQNDQTETTVLFMQGGCWKLIETQARRVFIKILCDQITRTGLPGNAYLHLQPWKEARLREEAPGGTSDLKLDESVTMAVPNTPQILIDPEERDTTVLLTPASGYNASTLTFTLGSPLPATKRLKKGTTIRWVQRDEVLGGLGYASVINNTWLDCPCRLEDVVGVWVLDEGGPSEELVFVKGTTWQRRRLTTDITPSSFLFGIDAPLFGIPEGTFSPNLHFRVYDTSGFLGRVEVSSVTWYVPTGNTEYFVPQLGLALAPTFATDIANSMTWVELIDDPNGMVRLDLARPLTQTHGAGTTLKKVYGTNPASVSYANHLPEAGYPPPVTPEGKFPGPYLYDNSSRGPADVREDSVSSIYALASVSNSDPNDARIYMANQVLVDNVDPATAPKTLGVQTVTIPGPVTLYFQPLDLLVDDASFFPTTAQVNNWKSHPDNPHPGYPPRVVVSAEGTFGRPELYYWGKGTGGDSNVIYVSGLARSHIAGSRVATYHEELPLTALAGVLASSAGFADESGKALLDFSFGTQETIDYDGVKLTTPTTGYFEFERGFIPDNSHDPFKVSNIDPSVVLGIAVVNTSTELSDSLPRRDGFSFSALLNGNALLMRLAWLIEQVRAAGVHVTFYDEKDRVMDIPVFFG